METKRSKLSKEIDNRLTIYFVRMLISILKFAVVQVGSVSIMLFYGITCFLVTMSSISAFIVLDGMTDQTIPLKGSLTKLAPMFLNMLSVYMVSTSVVILNHVCNYMYIKDSLENWYQRFLSKIENKETTESTEEIHGLV